MRVVDFRSRQVELTIAALTVGIIGFAVSVALAPEAWWQRLLDYGVVCIVGSIVLARKHGSPTERFLDRAQPLPLEAVVVRRWSQVELRQCAVCVLYWVVPLAGLAAAADFVFGEGLAHWVAFDAGIWTAIGGFGSWISVRRTAARERSGQRFYAAATGYWLRNRRVFVASAPEAVR